MELWTGWALEEVIVGLDCLLTRTALFNFEASAALHTFTSGKIFGGKLVDPVESFFGMSVVDRGENMFPVNEIEVLLCPSESSTVIVTKSISMNHFLNCVLDTASNRFAIDM